MPFRAWYFDHATSPRYFTQLHPARMANGVRVEQSSARRQRHAFATATLALALRHISHRESKLVFYLPHTVGTSQREASRIFPLKKWKKMKKKIDGAAPPSFATATRCPRISNATALPFWRNPVLTSHCTLTWAPLRHTFLCITLRSRLNQSVLF